MGLDKCIVKCVHHYSIIQSSFHCPENPLCSAVPSSPQIAAFYHFIGNGRYWGTFPKVIIKSFDSYKMCVPQVTSNLILGKVLILFCLFVCLFFGCITQLAGLGLVPQPGIQPGPPAVEAWSPNHWTVREFAEPCCLSISIYSIFLLLESKDIMSPCQLAIKVFPQLSVSEVTWLSRSQQNGPAGALNWTGRVESAQGSLWALGLMCCISERIGGLVHEEEGAGAQAASLFLRNWPSIPGALQVSQIWPSVDRFSYPIFNLN